MDQTVSNYTCQWKTRRWPRVIWYKVLDVARLIAYTNSCHIWRGTRMAHTNSRSILLKRQEPSTSSKRTSDRGATGRARGVWCGQKSSSWGSQCTRSTNTLWSFVWNVIRCDGMCAEMTNMNQIWNEKNDSALKELLETNSNCKSNLDEPCVVTWRVFIHKVGKKKWNGENTPSPAWAVWWKHQAVEPLRNHRPTGSCKGTGEQEWRWISPSDGGSGLEHFPNPKPQNYWLYPYCFICSWCNIVKPEVAHYYVLTVLWYWPWFCVTACLRLLLWFFFWLLDLSQFKHRWLRGKCSHQLQAMIQLGAESWRQGSDGAFAQNDVWQPPWKGFVSGHCLDSICICMFVVLSKTAKNED